jgi:hypothetical protein
MGRDGRELKELHDVWNRQSPFSPRNYRGPFYNQAQDIQMTWIEISAFFFAVPIYIIYAIVRWAFGSKHELQFVGQLIWKAMQVIGVIYVIYLILQIFFFLTGNL